MTDYTPREVEKIVDKAKKEDQQAQRAREIVDEAVTPLDERHNNQPNS